MLRVTTCGSPCRALSAIAENWLLASCSAHVMMLLRSDLSDQIGPFYHIFRSLRNSRYNRGGHPASGSICAFARSVKFAIDGGHLKSVK